MLLRKGDKRVGGEALANTAVDDPLRVAYPVLWAFLTQHKWEDDSPRDPGSMLVFVQDSMLKAMLRDRNDGTCLWVAAGSLQGLLDAVEGSLMDPGADWRLDRQRPGDQAKRVTKR